jgi:hypothetical protein
LSKVALSGNALGTGTFTIASPNGNTDRTLTLPDATGTFLTTATPGVPVNGPAFSAYLGTTQNLSTSVTTKLQINTELFDTANCFDTSTYRFTPSVAGYYQFSASMLCTAGAVSGGYTIILYKNGSQIAIGINTPFTSSNNPSSNVSVLLYMNGSTDYVEAYGTQNSGSTKDVYQGAPYTFLTGFLARSAT